MADIEGKVFINGEIVPASEAYISVFDRGFLYGDGVFETLRTYNKKIFLLDPHLERLYSSAALIRLVVPWSKGWIERAVKKTIAENAGQNDLLLRITVSRGVHKGGFLPGNDVKPTIVITTREIDENDLMDAWKVIVSKTIRNDKRSIDPMAKSVNYLNNILAGLEGRDGGADEAIMVNNNGKVTEGCVSNVFIVKEGVIITPPVTDGLLMGITRDQVIKLARSSRFTVIEESIEIDDLYRADEIFLTLSSQGIVPVTDIDGNKIISGNITKKLISKFNEMVDAWGRGKGT